MIANILGTEYTVTVKAYEDVDYFKSHTCDGYCDSVTHEIMICDMKTYPSFEDESREYCDRFQKTILRHELVHAFLNESGLQESSGITGSAWAKNEEMVDWIAIQFPKILKVFQETECL